MLEKTIEKKVCDYAKQLGFLCHKLTSFYNRGFPDRMFIYNGLVFFIEFKQKGKKLTDKQQSIHRLLSTHGARVYIVDDVDKGKDIIHSIKTEY